MRIKLLNYLRQKDTYLSGEELSRTLGITRAGVWKHIQELKGLGYEISAVPHLGYKLVSLPDKLFWWEITWNLNTKFLGRKIISLETTSSTMDIAINLGLNKEEEGVVVCSETQTKGRGRLGRTWFSPGGVGLYFSFLLRPEFSLLEVPKITLLSSLGVAEAIKEKTSLDIQIKWPNDIIWKEQKLGGILTEIEAEQDRVNFMVVGIGINVNNSKSQLIKGATSLYLAKGKKIRRVELLQEILRRIEDLYLLFKKEGFLFLIDRWRKFSNLLGHRVRVILPRREIKGEVKDVDSEGSLLIRTDSGVVERVLAGDVIKVT